LLDGALDRLAELLSDRPKLRRKTVIIRFAHY
jgi:hypothetical protein